MAKLETIKASELQRSSGKVLKRVANDREHLVVESAGYKVAVMLPYLDYEQLVRERAARQMKALLAEAGAKAYSEDEVMADVLQAVKEVRHARPKKK
jgi:prevent-host-death family protein